MSACTEPSCCRRGRRCWPVTARRWPRVRRAARRFPTWPARSSARVGPIPAGEAASYVGRGYPPGAQVGLDGLERIFESRLIGQRGGRCWLVTGPWPVAHAVQAPAVHTTISPALERAAVAAMGGHYAGIAVMNPRTGGLVALAGIAFSALQPPGSTMKIITAAGALQAHHRHAVHRISGAERHDPVAEFSCRTPTASPAGGRCSTPSPCPATRCSRRWEPGSEPGGWWPSPSALASTSPPRSSGAAEPTIPAASAIGDDLAVGSSAIGQGLVQATPLTMADVAATIAMGGRRPIPTLLAGQRPRFVRVVSGHVAREVQRMMVAVVQFGTGVAAQIPGVVVAGKTGTAELKNTTQPGQSRRAEHRCVVRRLRARRPTPVRGRRALPQPGRRGRDRGAPDP